MSSLSIPERQIEANVEYYQWRLYIDGVITAFLIKYMKMRMQTRDAALEAIDNAEKSASSARLEGRFDKQFENGDSEFVRAQRYFLRGDYEEARKRYQRASDYYNAAKQGGGQGGRQPIPDTKMAEMADNARTEKGLRSSFRQSDNLLFITVSAVLAVVVMQTTTQVYSQLLSFGISAISYISAYILGYGSQSLLGEAIELSRNR
jgi:tetratricopeptide (TPR) repeat protein